MPAGMPGAGGGGKMAALKKIRTESTFRPLVEIDPALIGIPMAQVVYGKGWDTGPFPTLNSEEPKVLN